MSKTLTRRNHSNFYGVSLKRDMVPGLNTEIRQGKNYSYIVFLENQLIKWKVIPQLSHHRKVARLNLYHRNRTRNGFHSQYQSAWGTPSGLRDIIQYIRDHELYDPQPMGQSEIQ